MLDIPQYVWPQKKPYNVKPVCIPDVGKPGKTPISQRIVTSDDLDLGKYGYKNITTLTSELRHTALKKTINNIIKEEHISKHDSAVKVMRRLNYLYVLTKNTQKTLSQYLMRDRNWIGKEYLQTDYTA